MKAATSDGSKRTWWAAGGGALLILAAITMLLTYRGTEGRKPKSEVNPVTTAKVSLTRLVEKGEGNVVAEEAQFFDPTPLFLPTEWNTDQNTLPASILKEPGQMFADFPSRLNFAEEGLRLSFPDTLQLPDKAADTITTLDGSAPFMGMGREKDHIETMPLRGGYLAVDRVDGGKSVLSEVLSDAEPPGSNWRPLEFMAVVNAAGLIGSLSFLERSGNEEVDLYFRNYLVQSLHLGERLAPGFYRISVGP